MNNTQKRCLIESVTGGVLAAIITFYFTHGNIAAAIGTLVLGVPAGYYGSCVRVRRQAKKNAQ